MEYHMFTRDKMELYMPELYHKLGVGVISWSPTSLNYDDGISLISRRAVTAGLTDPESKAIRTAKQLQLVPITSKLGCDYNQLNTGNFSSLSFSFFVVLFVLMLVFVNVFFMCPSNVSLIDCD